MLRGRLYIKQSQCTIFKTFSSHFLTHSLLLFVFLDFQLPLFLFFSTTLHFVLLRGLFFYLHTHYCDILYSLCVVAG